MNPFVITPDSSIEELAMFALSVHNLTCRMPIAIKAKGSAGVLIEEGEFIVSARECKPLECMFSGDLTRKIHIEDGKHIGTTMFASAILNAIGQRVAAIGIIDTLGMLSLEKFIADQDQVEQQVGGRRPIDKHFILRRQ